VALSGVVAARETIVIVGSGPLAHDVVRMLVADAADRRIVVVDLRKGDRQGDRSGLRRTQPSADIGAESGPPAGRAIDLASPSCARELADVLLELRPDVVALVALSESPVTPPEPWLHDAAVTTATTSALDRYLELGGKPPHVLLLSSTAVYGVAQGSPLVFDEQSALPRETVFESSVARWAQQLRDCERAIVVWAVTAGAGVGVLRTASVLGAPRTTGASGNAMDSPLAALLRAPFPIRVLGYDPPCQVVHYEDLARAVALAIDQRCGEVLNIVGPAVVPLSRLVAMAGVVAPPVPGPIADRIAPAAPEGALLRCLTLADGRRATALLGFRAHRTLEDCFVG
jgi:UDP-glucose 4-epimerase